MPPWHTPIRETLCSQQTNKWLAIPTMEKTPGHIYVEAVVGAMGTPKDEGAFTTRDDMLAVLYARLVARFGPKIVCVVSPDHGGTFISADSVAGAPSDNIWQYSNSSRSVPVGVMQEAVKLIVDGAVGLVIDRGAEWQLAAVNARPAAVQNAH